MLLTLAIFATPLTLISTVIPYSDCIFAITLIASILALKFSGFLVNSSIIVDMVSGFAPAFDNNCNARFASAPPTWLTKSVYFASSFLSVVA